MQLFFFWGGRVNLIQRKGGGGEKKGTKEGMERKKENIFRSRENTGKRMSGEYKYVYRGNENIVLRGRGG
jgi:hypothetical protein